MKLEKGDYKEDRQLKDRNVLEIKSKSSATKSNPKRVVTEKSLEKSMLLGASFTRNIH